jgi:pyruvate dehydrogenase (quinone)
MWEMLANSGRKRCYGIVGDALNPVMDALRRNGQIEFIHVRHEEYGVFAAVADAYLTGNPVAVCGTAGPGVTHLFNGLMDARKEGASVIAIAGDIDTRLIDTAALEALCANITETTCVTAISEGGRERTQHGNCKRLGSSGRSVSDSIGLDNG